MVNCVWVSTFETFTVNNDLAYQYMLSSSLWGWYIVFLEYCFKLTLFFIFTFLLLTLSHCHLLYCLSSSLVFLHVYFYSYIFDSTSFSLVCMCVCKDACMYSTLILSILRMQDILKGANKQGPKMFSDYTIVIYRCHPKSKSKIKKCKTLLMLKIGGEHSSFWKIKVVSTRLYDLLFPSAQSPHCTNRSYHHCWPSS